MGWEVASVTALQTQERPTELPLRQYVPEAGDNLGILKIPEAVEDFEPDVIYTTCEPGVLTALTRSIPQRIPVVAYVPIEGEPIVLGDWRAVLSSDALNWFTCSEYGQQIAKRDLFGKDVDFVYHGVDASVFRPDDEARERVRSQLGWSDKFVVMTVAANVRRKQHPRLFEAIALLHKTYKQRDVILYDHTVPFQHHWLEGWHLPQIADAMGIHDKVVFNPMLGAFGSAIPDSVSDALPSLADLYRAADLFVLPSQVEGFGLPIAEAMASGVPVLVTKYAAGWEVASPAGAAIEVHDWEITKNGSRLANVDPHALAKSILSLKRDPKRLARMRAAGLERVKAFDWEAFKEYVVGAIEAAREKGPPPVQEGT
jgi:glycosyltransferase involved in cell wall biosynthesis